MNGELAGRDYLRAAGMFDEPLGQFGAFAMGDHPTDDVAAKNIQDDVEVVGGPFHRAAQLGDVPTPQLVGLGGQQLRLLIRRMGELITAFAAFAMCFQQAIHGADRAMITGLHRAGPRRPARGSNPENAPHAGKPEPRTVRVRKRPDGMPLRGHREGRETASCAADTRSHAEPTVPDRPASHPPKDGVDPERS